VIDRAVVAYLDGLFIDYDAFVEQLSRGANQQRQLIGGAIEEPAPARRPRRSAPRRQRSTPSTR
jgi:hypothetical protein